jgi:hypothetical protein
LDFRDRTPPIAGRFLYDFLLIQINPRVLQLHCVRKGARPNHVGAAISRHKRAGRIEERDGKLYAT